MSKTLVLVLVAASWLRRRLRFFLHLVWLLLFVLWVAA